MPRGESDYIWMLRLAGDPSFPPFCLRLPLLTAFSCSSAIVPSLAAVGLQFFLCSVIHLYTRIQKKQDWTAWSMIHWLAAGEYRVTEWESAVWCCVYLLIKPYAHWYYLKVVSVPSTHYMDWGMYLTWPHLCLPVHDVLQHVRCLLYHRPVNFPLFPTSCLQTPPPSILATGDSGILILPFRKAQANWSFRIKPTCSSVERRGLEVSQVQSLSVSRWLS